jgi:DNA-binding IclR family transcriptional regulator
VTRWIAVLTSFTETQEWGVRDLAKSLGFARSSVHRILQSMEEEGLVTQDAETGKYRVGPELLRFALVVSSQMDLATVAPDILRAAARTSGETAVLAMYVRSRHQFRTVDAAESDHAVRYIPNDIGEWGSLHVGASGKGILAFLPQGEQEAILAELADPVPELNISKADLRSQMAKARALGFVISHGERAEGTVGAAAPIYDGAGRLIGDLIITWPSYRNSPAYELEVGAHARRHAAEISSALGFRQSSSGELG